MPTTINGTTGVSLVQDNVITSLNQPSGSVIQVANFTTGALATGTVLVPSDNTIPQNTEGNQYMSLVFVPKRATSKLKIEVVANTSHSVSSHNAIALFRDSVADSIGAVSDFATAGESASQAYTTYINANSTASTTFNVRCGGSAAGTTTFNGYGGVGIFGGVMASSITITEIVG